VDADQLERKGIMAKKAEPVLSCDVVEVPSGIVKRWKGEPNRMFRIQRPCSCGCDERDGKKGVGYITGSDKNGNGVTIWIADEKVYRIMAECIGQKMRV
jgi:hypothetical protein